MNKLSYSSPEISVAEIMSCGLLCLSNYSANDVFFGNDGEAGLAIGDDDINYGGSF